MNNLPVQNQKQFPDQKQCQNNLASFHSAEEKKHL